MRRSGVLAAVAAGVLAAGCASIPDHGAIHSATSDAEEPSGPVLYDPPAPEPGATPEQLAQGFLTAMQAQPVSSEDAREFLTDSADSNWDPGQQTVVYGGFPTSERVAQNRVELTVEVYAILGRRGSYTPQDSSSRAFELGMKKVGEQWRIADLPDAYLVNQTLFEQSYRPLSMYFISKSDRVAVPEPVYLPAGDQLATNAVNNLLRGPSGALGKVATTYIPGDVTLDVSVGISDDGRADVRLAGALDELSEESRELMSAQIVLTLRQIPGVDSVQILVNGAPYDVPGVDEVQDVDAWNRYDTSTAPSTTPLFAVRDDRLVLIRDNQVHEVAGPWEAKPEHIGDFGIDTSTERIAVLNEDRTEASVGSMEIDDTSRKTVLVGDHLLAPRWDPLGWLWLTDARNESTSIAVWRDGKLHSIPIGPLEGMRTRSISISPDGTRFAAIATKVGSDRPDADAAVYVGLIRRKNDTPAEVIGLHRVPLGDSQLHAPQSVAWRDASNLVLLAAQGSLNPQPFIVSIDGSSVSGGVDVDQPSLPDIGATSIAASGRISDPIYVGDDDGGIWQLDSDQRWARVSEKKLWTPHFPG